MTKEEMPDLGKALADLDRRVHGLEKPAAEAKPAVEAKPAAEAKPAVEAKPAAKSCDDPDCFVHKTLKELGLA